MRIGMFFFFFLVMTIGISPNESLASSVTQLCGEEICSNEEISSEEISSEEISSEEISSEEISSEEISSELITKVENADNFYEDENNKIYGEIVPDIIKDSIPSLVTNLDELESEELAENAIFIIFDIIEKTIFGEGTDFVIENFGERIIQMLTNGFTGLFEKTTTLVT